MERTSRVAVHPTERHEELRGISLCAGVGGLDLGLHLAEPGYRTVCYVERNGFASAALVARMADASWLRLLFGTICDPLTAERGAAAFISSLPVIPASPSAWPGTASGKTIPATSGPRSPGSSAKSPPLVLLRKRPRPSVPWFRPRRRRASGHGLPGCSVRRISGGSRRAAHPGTDVHSGPRRPSRVRATGPAYN